MNVCDDVTRLTTISLCSIYHSFSSGGGSGEQEEEEEGEKVNRMCWIGNEMGKRKRKLLNKPDVFSLTRLRLFLLHSTVSRFTHEHLISLGLSINRPLLSFIQSSKETTFISVHSQ